MTHISKSKPLYVVRLFLARVFWLYPVNDTQTWFPAFFHIWTLIYTGSTFSNGILLVLNLFEGKYNMFAEDFGFFLGHVVATFSCYRTGIDHKKWSQLIDDIADHNIYGKPGRFDKVKQKAETVGMFAIGFLSGMLVLFAIFGMQDQKKCEEDLEPGRICGFLGLIWWPKSVELTITYKRIFLVYQMMTACVMTSIGYVIYMIHQLNELILTHIEHLCLKFVELCSVEDPEEQFEKFKSWVEYHKAIIRMCRALNRLCNRNVGALSMTVPAVVACFGFLILSEGTLKGLVYVVCFLGVLIIQCFTGEKMQSNMLAVGTKIYLTNWENLDHKIKRWLEFVLLRTQRPIGLDVLPIGMANHVLIVTVLRATYSYITLLSQSMRR